MNDINKIKREKFIKLVAQFVVDCNESTTLKDYNDIKQAIYKAYGELLINIEERGNLSSTVKFYFMNKSRAKTLSEVMATLKAKKVA